MVARNLLKYIGYFMGKHHEKIPRGLIDKISMHKSWWDKQLNLHR
jgi:hypothetical protein